MKAEILSVGTEILIGSILNTNQQYLSRRCAELGIDVYRHATVGDNPARLAEALHAALLRSDLVITTGGLGPTADDITLEAAASAFGFPLELHQPTYRAIQKIVSRKGRAISSLLANQARVPAGSRVFPNRYGTAPGILKSFSHAGRVRHLLLLPGPPREMAPIFECSVVPVLKKISGTERNVFRTRGLRIYGKSEADVAAKVDDLLRLKPPVTVGIYARPAEVELKIMAKGSRRAEVDARIQRVERTALRRLAGMVVLAEDETLEERLGKLLRRDKKTLAFAESCTGGLAGHLLTSAAGASDYFVGSVTAYQNRVKSAFLGVSEAVIKKHGAVSPQCASAMAEGVRRAMHADFGIAITGIAGPTGGSAKKPVGLVFVGLSDGRKRAVRRFFFIGKREEIKFKAARSALLFLVERLSGLLQANPPHGLKDQVRI